MSQVLLAFRWYIAVQVFGLAVLPLCLRLFRHLPDRGYGVSKPLGLLLTGWTFWILTTFGWTQNTAGGILVAVVLLLIAGVSLRAGHSAIKLSLRTVLIAEMVFALAFVSWCLVRAGMPQIQTAGGEKWMEIAFLRAILRSDTFPPHDPWLSGFAISYYYFGYVIVAMVTRLASVPPSIAFNLGIATLFALVCTGSYSLVHNLVAAESKSWISDLKSQISGLLGPLLVTVMGNLEGLLEVLHARGIGPSAFWAWLDIRNIDGPPPSFANGSWVPQRFFWWWQASRVLQDYNPWGAEQEVIDEFPAFSFLLGDMHPHVLTLPFVLLALALALNLYLRIVSSSSRNTVNGNQKETDGAQFTLYGLFTIRNLQLSIAEFPFTVWEFLVYALCLGGLGFLNTWDFPVYLFVVTVAYALALLRAAGPIHRASQIADSVFRVVLLFVCVLLVGVFLYLPFWVGFRSQAGGVLINLFNGTRLPQFLVMFGPLAFVAVVFVVDRARRDVQALEVGKWTLLAVLSVLGVLIFVLGFAVLLVWIDVIPAQGTMAYLAAWVRGEPIPYLEGVSNARALISQRLLLRLLNPWTSLALVAFLVTISLLILKKNVADEESSAVRSSQFAIHTFVLLLFATGALLTLSVEYVFLRDVFSARMNTVFKFYFQAWVMWAIAGAYALTYLFRRGRVIVVAVAVLLIAAGLVYPVLAIPARSGEQGGPPTLDGAAYLAEMYADDYVAITWLNENVSGTSVILETPGGAYEYEGRVSAHTGLPTLLGWAGHEHQWRGNYDEQALREPDIETLYTSVDPVEVSSLLEKYGISYVYVGPLERQRYPAAGLAKFAGVMETVYDTGAVTIYQYHPALDNQP